ncbi:mechanosensitive ion channel family protein [Roseimaritima ulvae]|uniref:Putative MscS family protein YfkC n=1 Tax=Roseimaritima ulvae TaxID=980254 RepID=A0A5B9QV52_9BACT|nr:mechanosensitive ion channel domain-containing protein [Roseimaritima ulvae]QEG41832.1 putative MscS family protein YfkC [Roseimaritima ulvae]
MNQSETQTAGESGPAEQESATNDRDKSGFERLGDEIAEATGLGSNDTGEPKTSVVNEDGSNSDAVQQQANAQSLEQKTVDDGGLTEETTSADTQAEETQEDAVQLINDLQEINFLHIIVIVFLAWFVIWLARRLLPLLAERGPSQARLYILNAVPIIRLATMTVALLWVFPIIFRVNFENFLIIAGGASVAIGFAFKDYVSSLIAGIIAVFERPYRPGDWVKIGDDCGEVRSVGLRSLCLQTASDDLVTVPHTRIWDENISNANNGERTLMCVANFYVHPDHDANAIREALREVAMTSAYLEYGKPVLVMLADEPFATHYKVKAYPFDLRDQFAFISDLTARGKHAIRRAGGKSVAAPLASIATENAH